MVDRGSRRQAGQAWLEPRPGWAGLLLWAHSLSPSAPAAQHSAHSVAFSVTPLLFSTAP